MIATLALAALLTVPTNAPPVCLVPGPVPVDDRLREMYQSGRDYTDFLDAATRRTELWHGNTEKAEGIDPDLVARARALGGSWHLLAVAVDACSDSVSTIPYLAQLVAMVEGLEMRIVDSTVGREVMEAHPTSDGRAATPTVVLLDADFDEAGCFIERPPALKAWLLDGAFSGDAVFDNKMEWYEDDAGQSTVEAVVEMLEAAAAGNEPICR